MIVWGWGVHDCVGVGEQTCEYHGHCQVVMELV